MEHVEDKELLKAQIRVQRKVARKLRRRAFWNQWGIPILCGFTATGLMAAGYIIGYTDCHHDIDEVVKTAEDTVKTMSDCAFENGWERGAYDILGIVAQFDQKLELKISEKLPEYLEQVRKEI